MDLEEEMEEINSPTESYVAHLQHRFLKYLEYLENSKETVAVNPRDICKERAMFGIKGDTDVSPLEEDYLISKRWDAQLFESF